MEPVHFAGDLVPSVQWAAAHRVAFHSLDQFIIEPHERGIRGRNYRRRIAAAAGDEGAILGLEELLAVPRLRSGEFVNEALVFLHRTKLLRLTPHGVDPHAFAASFKREAILHFALIQFHQKFDCGKAMLLRNALRPVRELVRFRTVRRLVPFDPQDRAIVDDQLREIRVDDLRESIFLFSETRDDMSEERFPVGSSDATEAVAGNSATGAKHDYAFACVERQQLRTAFLSGNFLRIRNAIYVFHDIPLSFRFRDVSGDGAPRELRRPTWFKYRSPELLARPACFPWRRGRSGILQSNLSDIREDRVPPLLARRDARVDFGRKNFDGDRRVLLIIQSAWGKELAEGRIVVPRNSCGLTFIRFVLIHRSSSARFDSIRPIRSAIWISSRLFIGSGHPLHLRQPDRFRSIVLET